MQCLLMFILLWLSRYPPWQQSSMKNYVLTNVQLIQTNRLWFSQFKQSTRTYSSDGILYVIDGFQCIFYAEAPWMTSFSRTIVDHDSLVLPCGWAITVFVLFSARVLRVVDWWIVAAKVSRVIVLYCDGSFRVGGAAVEVRMVCYSVIFTCQVGWLILYPSLVTLL